MNMHASFGQPVADQPSRKDQLRSAFAFFRWAVELDRFPTVDQVTRHFECKHETAIDLVSVLRETYGLPA